MILSTARSTTAYNTAYIQQIGEALKVNQFELFHLNWVVYTRRVLAVGREIAGCAGASKTHSSVMAAHL